ncbi:hypothetical protein J2810_002282 [Chryseobacterium rhizosphaerae]|jgi:hypothetical protein|nr:hypothetical protein [Chryseobacterium rhizosphaerae]
MNLKIFLLLTVCFWKSAKSPEAHALKYVKRNSIVILTEVFAHHSKCLFMAANFMWFVL